MQVWVFLVDSLSTLFYYEIINLRQALVSPIFKIPKLNQPIIRINKKFIQMSNLSCFKCDIKI